MCVYLIPNILNQPHLLHQPQLHSYVLSFILSFLSTGQLTSLLFLCLCTMYTYCIYITPMFFFILSIFSASLSSNMLTFLSVHSPYRIYLFYFYSSLSNIFSANPHFFFPFIYPYSLVTLPPSLLYTSFPPSLPSIINPFLHTLLPHVHPLAFPTDIPSFFLYPRIYLPTFISFLPSNLFIKTFFSAHLSSYISSLRLFFLPNSLPSLFS